MTLDYMGRVVAAVMTPADNAVVALDLLAEGLLATGEDKTHDGGL
jgi:hypothetical protein